MFPLTSFLVPEWWLFSVAFGFGVIVGSFLNVYIYRFHTGKSLSGHSHCLSCATPLKWFELFPLLSYVCLLGRCRSCGCKIPVRYFVVELMTGLLFLASVTVIVDATEILLVWLLLSILVVITVYDFYHYIIPDSLTVALTVTVLAWLSLQAYLGFFPYQVLATDIVASLGGVFFFWLLWKISKGAWIGFGDVKLAFPLGLFGGAHLVFSFVVLSFWIGAIVSLLIVGFLWIRNRGKAGLQLPTTSLTMKSAVPFAPFMVASSLVILFTHFNVLELFSFA